MAFQSQFGMKISHVAGISLALVVIFGTSQSLSPSGLLFHDLLYLLDAEPSSTESFGKVPESDDAPKRLCLDGCAFYNETSSCHKLLQQGPCGDLQVFYPIWKGAEYGDCGCISDSDGCNTKVNSNRMVLPAPAPDSKQCYWAYSKGPCQLGEWYVLNLKSLQPECQKNPCSSSSSLDKQKSFILKKPSSEKDMFTFVLNGTCYQTYTQAFCEEGKYVQFVGTNDPYPKCLGVKAAPPMCMFGVAPVVGMPCEPGYKQVGDECVMANPEFE